MASGIDPPASPRGYEVMASGIAPPSPRAYIVMAFGTVGALPRYQQEKKMPRTGGSADSACCRSSLAVAAAYIRAITMQLACLVTAHIVMVCIVMASTDMAQHAVRCSIQIQRSLL